MLDLARRRVEPVQVRHRVGAGVDLAARDRHGPGSLGLTGGGRVGQPHRAERLAGGQVDLGEHGRLQAACDDVSAPLVGDGADDGAGHGRGAEPLHPGPLAPRLLNPRALYGGTPFGGRTLRGGGDRGYEQDG